MTNGQESEVRLGHILVLVDLANLEFCWRRMVGTDSGARLDYRAFRKLITEGRDTPDEFVRVYMSLPQNQDHRRNREMTMRLLGEAGFTVVTREATFVFDSERQVRREKGDMDQDIYGDAMNFMAHRMDEIEKIALVSGDRDFVRLVEEAHTREIPVVVYASYQNLANDLARAVGWDNVRRFESYLVTLAMKERKPGVNGL